MKINIQGHVENMIHSKLRIQGQEHTTHTQVHQQKDRNTTLGK